MSKRNRKTEAATPILDVAPEAATPVAIVEIPSRSIVPVAYRKARAAESKADPVRSAAKTSAGNAVVDNGDPVAALLRGLPLQATYDLAAKALGAAVVAGLKERYENATDTRGPLNVGQIRMNLGNRIRAAIKAGEFAV